MSTADEQRHRAPRDIAWQLLGRGANLVLGVFVTALTVRALGKSGFGEWSTLLAAMNIVSIFALPGLGDVAVRRAAGEAEREAEWVGALVTLRVALSVAVAVVNLIVLALVSRSHDMRVAAVILSLTIPATAWGSSRIIFQLRVRNAVNTAVDLANGIAWAAVVVAIYVADGALVAFAVGFTVLAVLTHAAYFFLSRREAPVTLRGSRALWGELARTGVPLGLASVLIVSYATIDQVLVYKIAGTGDAGLYGSVYRILERLTFVPNVLMSTLFPVIVAAHAVDPARMRRLVQSVFDVLLMISVPAAAIAIAGARPISVLLFGESFADAASALPVLMGAFVVICIGHLSGYLVITYGLQAAFVRIALAALAFNVVANLVLIPTYGFMAAAWVTLATEVLAVGLALRLSLKSAQLRLALGRALRIVLAGALLWLVGWGLRSAGVPLGVWAVAAGAAYVAALLGLRATSVAELRALMARPAA